MELRLLCDVIVVLNTAGCLCLRVVNGKALDLTNYKPYFTWKMAEEFARCSAGIIYLFFVVFCPIAGLQRPIVRFNRRYRAFLEYKLTKL